MQYKTVNRGSFDRYYENQYAPSLLKDYYTSVNDAETREKRSGIDPLASALTLRVGKLLTMNPPKFLDENKEEIKKIREEWVKNDYDSVFREAIISTRTHGFCVTEKLKNSFAGKNFLVHNLANGIIRVNYEDRLNIKSYDILPKMEEGERISSYAIPKQRELMGKNAFHYEIGRKKYNQQGESSLKPIWAQLVRANEIIDSMAEYDSRIGKGWLYVKVDPALYNKDISKLNTVVRKMNRRRFMILKSTKESPTDINLLTTTSTIDFSRDLETLVGIIASQTGLPTRWFLGSPKGFISSAKEDRYQVYATLKSIFAEYKDWIRGFIEKFYESGEAINNKIKEIEFDDEGVLEEIGRQMENGVAFDNNQIQESGKTEKQIKYLANKEQLKES